MAGPHTPTPAYDDAFKVGFQALTDLGLVYDCWLGEYEEGNREPTPLSLLLKHNVSMLLRHVRHNASACET